MKNKLYSFKNLEIRRITVLAICITFLVGYLSLDIGSLDHFDKPTNKADWIGETENREYNPVLSAYTLINPINISSPSDWALYPFITGNGSNLNPYTIENVEIQGSGVKTMEVGIRTHLNYTYRGIYINANGSFIIKNCKITSFSIGISLDIGVSPEHNHTIEGVEIDNCGVGVYNYWSHFRINISKCNISNCNWVTVKVPDVFGFPLYYGGFGVWVKGDTGSIIEHCQIQNCSIGLFAGFEVDIVSNELFNCGFIFDVQFIYVYDVILNNTVNGKPLGLFRGIDDLVITAQEASQYGQLQFHDCDNLHLSNFHIDKACSFGLIIISGENAVLQNIKCDNQRIGFLISANHLSANNLHTENCDVGFHMLSVRHSIYNRLLTDNTEIPIYLSDPIYNTTIQIEKSSWFYILDRYGLSEIQINSSVSSVNLPRTNLTEFDCEGFAFQLNVTGTYHISEVDPIFFYIDFTVVIFTLSPPLIPGFPLLWFYLAILFGILLLNLLLRYKKRLVQILLPKTS